jgi:sugar lactone lactonase YvrE
MHRPIAVTAIALVSLVVSACGGGGTGASPGPIAPGSGSSSQGNAVLLIPARTTSSDARRPAFVSPSASSVAIAVNGGTPTVADISPTSPLCTTGSGGRTCSVPFTAINGNDTIAFTLYDAANATGNVLGTGSSMATVAGAPFSVTVAIGGTVAKVVLTAATSALVLGSSTTVPITINAQDSDGNTIIGSAPFASPVTLTDSDTSGATTLSTTSVTAPGQTITLTYNGGAVTGGAVTIGATSTDLVASNVTALALSVSGGPCAPPTTTNHLYVANDLGGDVLSYSPPYTAAGTVLGSVGNPVAIAVDNANNLFVSEFGSSAPTSSTGDVLEFSPASNTTASAHIGYGTFKGPRGIALDGNGNLFAVDQTTNSVYEYTPPYTIGSQIIPPVTGSLYGIAFSPQCTLFLTAGSRVIAYAPPYTGAPITINSGLSSPQALAFDAAGNLYVADTTTRSVYIFHPPFDNPPVTQISLGSYSTPLGLAFDAAGDLFVDDYSTSTIDEFKPPFNANSIPYLTIPASSGLSLPAGIAFGP